MTIYASTPATGSALHKGAGFYLAAGVGYGRVHEPNPILVDIRRHYRGSWKYMLGHYNYVTYAAAHYVTKDWVKITEESQLDHARRVLTRLANLESTDD